MSRRRSFPLLSVLAVSAAGGYALYRVHHALAPFVLAAAFAYVINPLVSYFESRGLRRTYLVVAGYLAVGFGLWTGYASLKPLIVEQAEQLQVAAPGYLKQVQKLVAVQQAALTKSLPLPPKVSEHALETAAGKILEHAQALPGHLFLLLPFLAHALLVPFIGFFFLLDGPDGVENLIQSTPSRYVEQAIHLLSEIDTALGNYLRGIIIVAVAIAVTSYVGLLVLGVDNALAIALLSGVSSFVPYLGAVIGILVGGAMAFYQFGTLSSVAQVALLFVGIRLADEIFLQPVIAKHSVHLHPMVFLLALVLGGEMFGFLGLVFAIPAACILKALIQVTWQWYATEARLSAPDSAAGVGVPYT
ncbi:MAG: AI-2E family transporter [Elusimicrobiota bacterium]|nr:AI-2E family transporter [Elusimicrobiota bacterium]